MQRSGLLLCPMMVLGAFVSTAAFSQDYPNRVITMVVNAAPGGGIDVLSRLVSQRLSEDLKQNVIVTNKDGASGILGARFVSTSKPDGYTLLFGSSELVVSPFLTPDNSFDLSKEVTPISRVAYSPFVMAINPKISANNPRELVEYIKQHEKEFRWGIPGIGTPANLGTRQFNKLGNVNPDIVPYASTAPQMVGVMSGEVSGGLVSAGAAKANVESGKLKGLAVTSLETSDFLPGVPTVASFGFPGYDVSVWYGIWGPKDMPPALVKSIHQAVLKALDDQNLKDKIKANGTIISASSSPTEFAAYVDGQLKTNAPLIRDMQAVSK